MKHPPPVLVTIIPQDAPWRAPKPQMRAALLKAAEAAAKGRRWTEVLFRTPGGTAAYFQHMSGFITAGAGDTGGWNTPLEQSLALCFAAAAV